MHKVYIASSLHNADRVQKLAKLFISHGIEISYDWTTHGQVFSKDELKRYGEAEINGVLDADVLFFLQPGRAGAHVELGIALAMTRLGRNIAIVLLEEEPVEQKTFYYLDSVNKFDDIDDAINFTLRILGVTK